MIRQDRTGDGGGMKSISRHRIRLLGRLFAVLTAPELAGSEALLAQPRPS